MFPPPYIIADWLLEEASEIVAGVGLANSAAQDAAVLDGCFDALGALCVLIAVHDRERIRKAARAFHKAQATRGRARSYWNDVIDHIAESFTGDNAESRLIEALRVYAVRLKKRGPILHARAMNPT